MVRKGDKRQLSMFPPPGARGVPAVPHEVQHPGIRGGRYYYTESGHVRYGTPPKGAGESAASFAGMEAYRLETRLLPHSGLLSDEYVTSPSQAAQIFRTIADLDRERFYVLHLEQDRRVKAIECVSQGDIASSIVHPRETFKNAVKLGTARIVIFHNHPSGVTEPSKEDLAITQRLHQVAVMLGIGLDGHIITGSEGYTFISHDGYVHDTFPWGVEPHDPDVPDAWHGIAGTTSIVMPSIRERWGEPLPVINATKEMPAVEGHYVAVPVPAGERAKQFLTDQPAAVGTPIRSPYEAALLARRVLDPGSNRVLLFLALDTKDKVTGVYPLAHDEIGMREVQDAMCTIVGSGARRVVLVAGENGEAWTHQVNRGTVALDAMLTVAGIQLTDVIKLTGPKTYWSAHDDKEVQPMPQNDVNDGAEMARFASDPKYIENREREAIRKSLWYIQHEDMPAAGWFQKCVLERRQRKLKNRLAELGG